MIRAVIDTNLLVSGMLWFGPPNKIYQLAGQGKFTIVTSETLVNELNDTLEKPKLARVIASLNKSIDELIADYRILVEIIEPAQITSVSRDKDDDAVLACGIAGKVDAIVTGDKDLLVLDIY